MSKKIVITDYGVGNLLSILRAFQHCCENVTLETDPASIQDATHLVVPGVGAFGQCVESLKNHGFEQPIRDHIAAGKPMLGVCVGMQMLFDSSDEFGHHAGLGLIPGKVTRLPEQGHQGSHKIPNIGWEKLNPARSWSNTLLDGLSTDPFVYLVHSYSGHPASPEDRLAYYDLNGIEVCAAVQRGNIMGTQFHPEKSGPTGLAIIKRFCV